MPRQVALGLPSSPRVSEMSVRDALLSVVVAALLVAVVHVVWVRIQDRDNPEPPTIFDVARCQRAILDAEKGREDALLIDYCRKQDRVSVNRVQTTEN